MLLLGDSGMLVRMVMRVVRLLMPLVLVMADQVNVPGSDSVTHGLRVGERIDLGSLILGRSRFMIHEMERGMSRENR